MIATLSVEAYHAAFVTARGLSHPAIDAYETRMGALVDRAALDAVARVLACPLKARPPNWQHGRVIYATARRYFEDQILSVPRPDDGGLPPPVLLLDIGTAKGFSALMLCWALRDAGMVGRIVSLDVIDPLARVRRNTVAEVEGPLTLAETLAPWREAQAIEFVQSDARLWLTAHPERIHVAVVDGKHTYEAVSWEASLLAARQQSGDVIIFDDLQIPGVMQGVRTLPHYDVEQIASAPDRIYGMARRR